MDLFERDMFIGVFSIFRGVFWISFCVGFWGFRNNYKFSFLDLDISVRERYINR